MTWKDHSTVAEGFLEIGLPIDAAIELEKIAPEDKVRPEVFLIRLQVCVSLGKWELAEACAARLLEFWPETACWWVVLAVCARRTKGIDAAEKLLQEAVSKFPEDGKILYQLACIAAVKGENTRSRLLLAAAIGHDKSLELTAKCDRDLQDVWEEIRNLYSAPVCSWL